MAGAGSGVDGRPSVVSELGNEFATGYELRIVVGTCWAIDEEVVVECYRYRVSITKLVKLEEKFGYS